MLIQATKILFVDSDSQAIASAKAALRKLGCVGFVAAESFADAMAALDSERFDMVFIDLNMPHKRGVKLYEAIKNNANERVRTTPTITVLSGISQNKHIETIAQEDMDNISMFKPFTDGEVVDAVKRRMNTVAVVSSQLLLSDESDNSPALVNAMDAILAGNLVAASNSINEKLKKDPKSARLNYMSARISMAEGNNKAAMARVNSVLAGNKNHLPTLTLKASIQIANGSLEDAIKTLEAAQVISPCSVQRLVQIANLNLTVEHFDQSEDKFKRALNLDPGNQAATIGLVKTYFEMGKYDIAENLINKSQDRATIISDINARGVLLSKSGYLEKAIDFFKHAHSCATDHGTKARIYYNLALCHAKKGEYKKSECCAKDALTSATYSEVVKVELLVKIKSLLGKLQTRNLNGGVILNTTDAGRKLTTKELSVVLGVSEESVKNKVIEGVIDFMIFEETEEVNSAI